MANIDVGKKRIAIIGVGNCGSQVAALAEKKYSTLFDCIYINSSAADLGQVVADEDRKIKVGLTGEVEGSGKNRQRMKEVLRDEIGEIFKNDSFKNIINEKQYCYVIASTAGGTGSGTAPILLEILRSTYADTNFILIGVLPQIGASLMEQSNTVEFLSELYETLGPNTTYMLYDNESTADLPPTKALEVVNEQIVEDIRVLSGIDNKGTPYESIDEADMESIITTPGRMMVIRLKKVLTEKNLEDTRVDDMLIKAAKKSAHCETDRNKRVKRWGVITYFTEPVNRLYSGDLAGVLEFIGTPIERFNHNAINESGDESLNFIYIIASGLSPINDRAQKIATRMNSLKAQMADANADKFIFSENKESFGGLIIDRDSEERYTPPEDDEDDELDTVIDDDGNEVIQRKEKKFDTSGIFERFMK